MGPLGNGVDYCRGFYQSLRPTQMGLSLNLDMSARAFYRNILVSDFVSEYLGKSVTRSLSDQRAVKAVNFTDANGTAISILRYYHEKYGTTHRLSYLPALIAGTDAKPVYLPMELKYHGSGHQLEVTPSVGAWNMKNLVIF
nr:hypothetical protein [Tanacetum cinerariifolium]